ncbi:hypothetical protein [Cognatilysobacter lacus]|uniref:Alginate export domain-containing protein n=1 Tax=Cognatilysobacter lacus TaxID=1643323 RepID=A0A5D8Z960_9GAMM|nr:hypothetical protein [Lysobacter lacus]TZF91438.1 hypothetical protein FW784_01785 [Lysobacter lacus]
MSARLCVAGLLALAGPLHAAEPARQAGGVDIFVSSDADNTEIRRAGATVDWHYSDVHHYRGLALERAVISPLGGPARDFDRAFLRFADSSATWQWSGRVGTDGHRLLGAVSLVKPGARRAEYFVERDLLETRGGIARGQTVTFAGAAADLPIGPGERRQLTLLAGAQDFEDGNWRGHLRATYIDVISERIGLSAQLRVRAFHNSEPSVGDYFSPRDFVEAVPTLQIRHRLRGGWSGVVAAGWGTQRHTGADWRPARLVQASLTSPERARSGYFRATFGYSDTPGVGGEGYGYRQGTLQWIRTF